ncbi:MAG TPA: adenylate kinase [Dehalococcoidia bacterium]|nr:adenylate kinase [Dehalococcoidia bacterium]
MQVILLGAPGSGKGTQAEVLSQEIGLLHIASGDLFRQAEKEGTDLGLLAKSYMEKGLLVPDEITIQMLSERITSPESSQGFILDGFPRTLEQAQALDKALAGEDKAIDKVVYIKVSNQELLRRLSGRWICRQCQTPYHLVSSPPRVAGKCDHCGGKLYQRPDDTRETAEKRLEVYFTQTVPLIDYYQQKGELVEINGEQSIEEVGKELLVLLQ